MPLALYLPARRLADGAVSRVHGVRAERVRRFGFPAPDLASDRHPVAVGPVRVARRTRFCVR
jgi:hypothetical protein